MKTLFLTLACVGLALPLLRADEVALLTLEAGKSGVEQQVAIEFFASDAPATVDNFKKLANKRFYNGLAIHRAFPHLLVQMGDPFTERKDRTKVGTGGPGYTLAPEIRRKHTKGAVSMARLPDSLNPSRVSNGSQFFICLAPMPAYDGQYTVFGQVLWGLEVLDALSTRPVDSNDYPVERIEIRSLKIVPREQLPASPSVGAPAKKPSRRWWQIFG